MLHPDGDDHLVFPEGYRVDDGGLDFFRHNRVGGLDHPDLRAALEGDRPGQLQIINLLFKAVAHGRQIFCRLHVLGKARFCRLVLQGDKLPVPGVLQLFLSRRDVHGKLFEIGEVRSIHLVEHRDILEQGGLVPLKLCGDDVYVRLHL